MDDSSEDDYNSDSDDNMERLPKFSRAGYETFEEDAPQRRKRTREEMTYGVFMEDSDEGVSKKKPYNRRKEKKSSQSMMFVKGATQAADQETSPPSTEQEQNNTSEKVREEDPVQPTETSVDPEIAASRKKANDEFLLLLNKARSKHHKPSSERIARKEDATRSEPPSAEKVSSNEHNSEVYTVPSVPVGLGFQQKPKPVKKDPNLGNWEKHTKGIGMKLLSKMGYKGSGGLEGSSKRKKVSNIARPVEVKVRPNQLGLGFGGFQEASRLKANRQLEAQVRGTELADESKTGAEMDSQGSMKVTSSAIPTTDKLLSGESWRRGSKKKAKRKVMKYTEILSSNIDASQVVIDMRGPSHGEQKQDGSELLAPEILHNVTLLLQTYENKLHSASQFVSSSKRKIESLESDVKSLETKQKKGSERATKLRRLSTILQELETLSKSPQEGDTNAKIKTLVQDIKSTFSPEERLELNFSTVMLPSLLSDLIRSELSDWQPLVASAKESEKRLKSLIQTVTDLIGSESDPVGNGILTSVFMDHVVPCVQEALNTSRWDAQQNPDEAIAVYELIIEIAKSSLISPVDTDLSVKDDHIFAGLHEQDVKDSVSDKIYKEIVHETVFPKLSQCISTWKPIWDKHKRTIADPINRWVIPWIPHLQHKSLLPSLLPDCKRKLRSSVAFLQKSCKDDDRFSYLSLQLLQPWQRILKKESLQSIVSSLVFPRLSEWCRQLPFVTKPSDQDWLAVDRVFRYYCTNLLSDIDLLSIVEGCILVRWARFMHTRLLETTPVGEQFEGITTYWVWRNYFFSSDKGTPEALARNLLREDPVTCQLFYAVLLMLKNSKITNTSALEMLYPQESPGVKSVLARRSRERKQKDSAGITRLEHSSYNGIDARVRLQQNGIVPTFREVVEEFASEANVEFQPRIEGVSSIDGKQVFMFGHVPVYLERDVAFANVGGSWNPVSLDDLASLAK